MTEQPPNLLTGGQSLLAGARRRVVNAQAAFQQRAVRSAVWTGHQRYSVRVTVAFALLAVIVLRGGHPSAQDAALYLLSLPALFLPLFVGPRQYALALAFCALLGAVVSPPSNALLIFSLVLIGLAGSQLPIVLAVPPAALAGTLFAIGELHAGSGGALLQTLSWFAATFAGAAATHLRRIAAARQTAMLAELERSNAELRLAHEQLRLDSQRAGELAAAEERERIAREIHDVLAHTLTVLVVQVGAVKRLVTRDPERAQQQLDLVAQLTRDGLAEVRRSIHELRSADEEGSTALATLVAGFGERTGTACTFAVAPNLPALPPALSKALYRVTQEALTNAVRHGNAKVIDVQLASAAGSLQLTIQDDGIGAAAPPPVVGGGNGLRGAVDRLHSFGGSLTASPRQEGGFRVQAAIPLEMLTGDRGRPTPGNNLPSPEEAAPTGADSQVTPPVPEAVSPGPVA